ncbi:twin-arginine translocase TatA/TatE family subunit [Mesorhizobium sp. 1B3]|uniref:twin-arginine translocase TatA/TatE family subunit n=1 Tax=Mesorhizobium sp. 1B3 TaxID=3243599 RepID=UPI003D98F17D
MGALSVWHWLIVLAIVLLLFGRGRVSGLMGDLGKGLGVFRRELGGSREKQKMDRP